MKLALLLAAGPGAGLASASRTTVVTLAASSATAIVDGGSACAAATWFSYSGGGVAVGSGQALCADDLSPAAVMHGFSGRRE